MRKPWSAPRGWCLLAVMLVGSACGSSAGERTEPGPSSTTAASSNAKFCAGWEAASTDEARLNDVLQDAPAEIADAAAVLGEGGTLDDDESAAAFYAVSAWVESNCKTAVRHVAPPAGADLAGLTLCSVFSMPRSPPGDPPEERVVLYGEADRAEPYDGPMIGVFTNTEGPNEYLGDGDRTAITVRGKPAKSAPISVFQQTILPELGTVIAWTEDGHGVGLFGRLLPGGDQTAQLIALAERLELVDGRFVLPAGALPEGYREVFAGAPDANWSVIGGAILGRYQLRYQAAGQAQSIVTLAGQQLDAEQFDTFRFFALPVSRVRIAGRDTLFGSLWSENDGPYIATWREPDGFTVRITGIGTGREQVRAVAEQSRELDPTEWEQLVRSAKPCKVGPRSDSGGEGTG